VPGRRGRERKEQAIKRYRIPKKGCKNSSAKSGRGKKVTLSKRFFHQKKKKEGEGEE